MTVTAVTQGERPATFLTGRVCKAHASDRTAALKWAWRSMDATQWRGLMDEAPEWQPTFTPMRRTLSRLRTSGSEATRLMAWALRVGTDASRDARPVADVPRLLMDRVERGFELASKRDAKVRGLDDQRHELDGLEGVRV